MTEIRIHPDFPAWREAARHLLRSQTPPEDVLWSDGSDGQLPLNRFAQPPTFTGAAAAADARVPSQFIPMAKTVSHHRDQQRWPLLYRLLWRLTHGEPHLLSISVDDDVHQAEAMEKAVRRDVHKSHAFVRFRRVERAGDEGPTEHFVAFHRPDHFIVPLTAPWFARRFAVMHWTLLTPDASASWDGHQLCFGPGVSASEAPAADALEELWRTYYANIFNPARVKVKAMKKEMPLRHWPTLPETDLIDQLLREAPARVEAMMKANRGTSASALEGCPRADSAAQFVPMTLELPVLRDAANKCRGCDIYCNATQVVFGEGPATAEVMFVGEQPGDQEDLAGKPFVGPSGQLLDGALVEAGIDRGQVYVTNAVKHFKFEPRGPRRIHAKPNAREMAACRPWLEAEIASVRPKLIVCLGATAAQSLMGPQFRITRERGRVFADTAWAPALVATVHPSSILRQPDAESREQAHREFVDDLKIVKEQMMQISRPSAEASARRVRGPRGDQAGNGVVTPTMVAETRRSSGGTHAPSPADQPRLF
jgi:probable DNA metabolism protein